MSLQIEAERCANCRQRLAYAETWDRKPICEGCNRTLNFTLYPRKRIADAPEKKL